MDFLNNIYQCFVDERNDFKELLLEIHHHRKRDNTSHKYHRPRLGHNHANERKHPLALFIDGSCLEIILFCFQHKNTLIKSMPMIESITFKKGYWY